MNMICEYIKYIRKAQGRHQIHSPYVYDFVDVCIQKALPVTLKNQLTSIRKELRNNHTPIDQFDLGAGSKIKESTNTIARVYKKSSSKGTFFNLLYQISSHYQPKLVLELGTNLGLGTIALASGIQSGKVISIEGCKNTLTIAQENIGKLKLQNIELINTSFDNYLDNLNNVQFDVVYIDGDHKGKSLERYLNQLKEFTHDETVFILDDIRWSKDMFFTWNKISQSSNYQLSMDLFKIGILVKKQSKYKEHFVIKIKNILKSM